MVVYPVSILGLTICVIIIHTSKRFDIAPGRQNPGSLGIYLSTLHHLVQKNYYFDTFLPGEY